MRSTYDNIAIQLSASWGSAKHAWLPSQPSSRARWCNLLVIWDSLHLLIYVCSGGGTLFPRFSSRWCCFAHPLLLLLLVCRWCCCCCSSAASSFSLHSHPIVQSSFHLRDWTAFPLYCTIPQWSHSCLTLRSRTAHSHLHWVSHKHSSLLLLPPSRLYALQPLFLPPPPTCQKHSLYRYHATTIPCILVPHIREWIHYTETTTQAAVLHHQL